jgi:AcrR family transcriptional regulator
MTSSSAVRQPRSDGLRNRQLLLTAAAVAFAELGTEVSIAEIAQRAGIAKGTVFRHFASKDDLIAAIMGEMLDSLIATGTRLADAVDPAAALLEFMTAGTELLAKDRALCEVVGRPSLQQPAIRAGIDRLCAVVETLTDRARRAGAVRDDITGQDIVLLLAGVHRTAAPLADAQPQLWRRYLGLAFDGIQARHAQPLPHPPPGRFEPASSTARNARRAGTGHDGSAT